MSKKILKKENLNIGLSIPQKVHTKNRTNLEAYTAKMPVREKGKMNKMQKYIDFPPDQGLYQAQGNKNFICCKESRIESPTSFYGCFYIGPFDESLAQTLAHNLRRTLLSELTGFAITAVEIDGVYHQFSNIPGTKETMLDILSNLQNIVLSGFPVGSNLKQTQSLTQLKKKMAFLYPTNNVTQIAYLRVRGPGVIKASDIILPAGLNCVSPDQYIATLAEDGVLNMKIFINQGKNAIKQNQNQNPNLANKQDPHFEYPQLSHETNSAQTSPIKFEFSTAKSNKIFLDSVFMPVTKVNAFVESNFKATDFLQSAENKLRSTSNSQLDVKQGLNSQNNIKKNDANNIKTNYANNIKTNYAFVASDTKQTHLNQSNLSALKNADTVKQNFIVLSNTNSHLQNMETFSTYPNTNALAKQTTFSPDIASVIAEGPFSLMKASQQSHIVLEIWTNGSIHPRQALKSSLNFLTTTFMTLNNVKILGSMYKSDITYKQILKNTLSPAGPDL